jgi:peptidoglycan/LPS O-acetylase OafA/YrhL
MATMTERRYDLDWLRVLGVLLLIPFHAALIFVLDPNAVMYIKDSVYSRPLDVAAGFIHMWHMPMLFMVSGAASYFALEVRSAGEYLRERTLRLLIPLMFGVATYVPFTVSVQHNDVFSLAEGYARFFQIDLQRLDGMAGTFTPAHLWFMLYLFVYSIFALPLFLALRSETGRRRIEFVATRIRAPLTLFALGLPLTAAAATGVLGEMNPLYYFLAFVYGYLVSSHKLLQQAIGEIVWIALAYGLFAATLNTLIPIAQITAWSPQWILLGIAYQMGRWSLTLATLGLGYRFLNRTSRVLSYAGEAAMPFYLLHMTFSVAAAYFVIQLHLPVLLKYVLIVTIASLVTLAACELLRHWNPTRLLFGMKPIAANPPPSTVARSDRVSASGPLLPD